MRHAPLDATGFLKHIGPTFHRRRLACERNGMFQYWKPHIAGQLGSQRASRDPSPKVLLPRSSGDVAASFQQTRSQHCHEAPPCHPHRVHRLSFPRRAEESQNRVTLEKLKSWRIIAGTRSLPVSDVIASAGLVKASILLKARKGLS